MALNDLGGEKRTPMAERAPVTLPAVSLPPDDDKEIEREVAEAAARVAQTRIIKAGLDAWRLTQKSASFENWMIIGKALQVGRNAATCATGATTGARYSKTFYSWANERGFGGMSKADRWSACDLVENIDALEKWRASLPEKQRRRLINPLSNMRRWRKATQQTKPVDRLKTVAATWARFKTLMEDLPPEDAAPLWQAAHDQADAALRITP